ncbi:MULTISPECIES: post-transcriptional regulator [Virgibacillus]|uniref:Post-transcriptional regulator n=1 Tax=Virgibacillus dokdonensis TaxID=302167 RepID=A0A2K9J3B1_9BACI|nr:MULTISPECIES: post-transcriptional regulator [Virgibacillus]AUJ26155.1 Post-transcriptional regulator ComN [Virgibacillus dokdonensis]
MEIVQTVSEWKEMVRPALQSKAEEFHLMGYEEATPEDVWKCLVGKVWKGDPEKRIYEVVQDIFQLTTATYISYLTVSAQQNDDLFASIAAVTNTEMNHH